MEGSRSVPGSARPLTWSVKNQGSNLYPPSRNWKTPASKLSRHAFTLSDERDLARTRTNAHPAGRDARSKQAQSSLAAEVRCVLLGKVSPLFRQVVLKKMAETGHAGTQAPQSMHSTESMNNC